MSHPNGDDLDRYLEHALNPDEIVAVGDHLLWCEQCNHQLGNKQMLVRLRFKLKED